MNFKKYHVSKNLFDMSFYEGKSGITVSGNKATGKCDRFFNVKLSIPPELYGQKLTWSAFIKRPDNPNTVRLQTVDNGSYNYGNNITGEGRSTVSFTATSTISLYVNYANTGSDTIELSDIMLNTGSQPQPYEPYSSEVWHNIPYYVHNTSTGTITTLPAVIYANDTTVIVGLKGNMEQASGVSPTNPIMPNGTGERTGNLFDSDTVYSTYKQSDGMYRGTVNNFYTTHVTPFTSDDIGKTFTFTMVVKETTSTNVRASANINGTAINGNNLSVAGTTTVTFTVSSVNDYLYLGYGGGGANPITLDNIMLNLGSTALPYEPYGYKIPISSADTTTPVYLGEVESTRRIRKLVLTGEEDENWNITNSSKVLYLAVSDFLKEQDTICYCTHYETVNNVSSADDVNDGECTFNDHLNWLYIKDSNYTSAQSFKNYLAQQYAAGTPVTVWYVLATPETGIVNEPLMRIGDYADTVSNVSIPVTAGANTLSVDTTVQPSEVTVNYKGWHPVADVHERENGQWD